jgi:hypothetical protein
LSALLIGGTGGAGAAAGAAAGVAADVGGGSVAGRLTAASAVGVTGTGVEGVTVAGGVSAGANEVVWTAAGAAGWAGLEARYPPAAAAPTHARLSAANANRLDHIAEAP